MSTPLDRDRGPLPYAPKWVRDDQRIQDVIKEIQEFTKPATTSESKTLSRKSKNLPNQNSADRRPRRLSTGVCRARSSQP